MTVSATMITQQYLSGKSASAIGIEYNIDRHTVMEILRDNEIEIRSRSTRHALIHPAIPTNEQYKNRQIFTNGNGRFFYYYPYRKKTLRQTVVSFNCHICQKKAWGEGRNHTSRRTCSPECRDKIRVGPNNTTFVGTKNSGSGYTLVYMPDHPHAKKGYVYEHRIVAEKKYGFIGKEKVVHHKNYDKKDNTPSNLIPLTSTQHRTLHSNIHILIGELYKNGVIIFNESTLKYELAVQK